MIGGSNKVKICMIKEVTPGTTPSSPAMQDIRYNGESLNYTNSTVQSEEIRDDRNVPDLALVGRSVGGDVNCEFSALSYDDIIHSGLLADAAWTEDELSGTTIAATATGFTDSGSGFVSAGFDVGQFVQVSGFGTASINGFYRIVTITAGEITTYPAPPTTDAAGDSVTISGGTAKSGTTDQAYTIQKAFTDLSTPSYVNYRGCRISAFNFGIASESKITFGYTILGMSAEVTETQISGRTLTAKTTTDIMNASTNVFDAILVSNDLTSEVFFTEFSTSHDNQFRELKAVGTLGSVDVRPGTINAMATVNPYFENIEMLEAFNANESFSLSFRLTDSAGYSYIVSYPKAKFTSQTLAAGSKDTDMVINGQVQALYDSASGCSVRVDRFAP